MGTTSDNFSDPNNLKAVHSIEAILVFKRGDGHPQQHLFPSHLLSTPLQLHQQNKKRHSDGHDLDRKSSSNEFFSFVSFVLFFFFSGEINSSN